jgi:nitrous oxide reductase accessory protein NosL
MYKIIIISAIVLFFAACSSEKEISVKSDMFQSVKIEDAVLMQVGNEKESCSRCGMNLAKYYKTNHSATHSDKVYQYCSIHCLEDHLGEGISLKNPKVVDVSSLKFIDVVKAHYVVGSNIRGTMSKVSKYAFSGEVEAKKFQAENGGEIMDFYKALEITKKDFKNYK